MWVPLPLTAPGLVMTATGAFLNAEYTSYQNGSGFDEESGLAFGGEQGNGRDFSGNSIVRTPDFSGNIGIAYAFEFEDSELEVAADAYYNSGYYFSAQNTSRSEQDEYHVYNARISYLYLPWNVRFTAFGKNMGNEHYALSELPTDFGTNQQLAPPATYGIRLNWDY